MLSIDIINTLIDHFHHGTIGDALHRSLAYLEKSFNLEGIAIVIEDINRSGHTLIASSQMRNLQGMPLKPLIKFDTEGETVFLTSVINTEDLSFHLEIDIEESDTIAAYFAAPIPSSVYNIIFVLFGAHKVVESIDMDPISKIFSLLLRDSHFLRQIKEKTNKVNIDDFTGDKKPREIETYKELFESTDDAILILDENYTVVYMNHSGESITGYSQSALYGNSIKEYISKIDANIFDFKPELLPSNFDLNLTTTSNEIVRLGVIKSSLLKEEGYTVLIFRDITTARLMEERLQTTSDFLMKLVDNSVVAIVACEMNEKIMLFNPSAQKLFGYSHDEAVGTRVISELFPSQEAWNGVLDRIADQQYGGETRLDPTKYAVLSANGEEISVNISAYTIPLVGETKKAVVLFVTDLREQLKMEEKLSDYRTRLAEKEKEALFSELAGAMAHELNQPLMSILGYATLLKKPNLADEKKERAVTHIASEAERMADIVKKIGNLTRYETRKYVGSANILDLDKSSQAPK